MGETNGLDICVKIWGGSSGRWASVPHQEDCRAETPAKLANTHPGFWPGWFRCSGERRGKLDTPSETSVNQKPEQQKARAAPAAGSIPANRLNIGLLMRQGLPLVVGEVYTKGREWRSEKNHCFHSRMRAREPPPPFCKCTQGNTPRKCSAALMRSASACPPVATRLGDGLGPECRPLQRVCCLLDLGIPQPITPGPHSGLRRSHCLRSLALPQMVGLLLHPLDPSRQLGFGSPFESNLWNLLWGMGSSTWVPAQNWLPWLTVWVLLGGSTQVQATQKWLPRLPAQSLPLC